MKGFFWIRLFSQLSVGVLIEVDSRTAVLLSSVHGDCQAVVLPDMLSDRLPPPSLPYPTVPYPNLPNLPYQHSWRVSIPDKFLPPHLPLHGATLLVQKQKDQMAKIFGVALSQPFSLARHFSLPYKKDDGISPAEVTPFDQR